MARFGFVGPTYQSLSPNADAQRCMNFIVENIESGAGKAQFALYNTPGLKAAYQFAKSPVRGLAKSNSRAFAVVADSLYELFTDGSSTLLGQNMANDGLLASMAVGPAQILIASAGVAYVYNLQTNVLVNVDPAQLTNVALVGYTDGSFIALIINSDRFQISVTLDATQWPGTDVTQVSVFPDNVLSMIVDHREIWLFGVKATIPYYNSGNADFPFDPVPGGYIEQGIIAKNSPAKLDNTIFWLGGDDRGAGIAWRATGYLPTRISNHAVETIWQSYARIDDAIGYSYQENGHIFYILTFPTANATWGFDVSANMWHERGFFNEAKGDFDRHRSQNHIFAFNKHLVGDYATGNIYQMSTSIYDDFGNAIRRFRRAPHISQEQEWIFHHSIQIDIESGVGPQPALQGTGAATILTVKDVNGAFWNLATDDIGHLVVSPGLGPSFQAIILNDAGGTTSWQLAISPAGVLSTTKVAFGAGNPTTLAFTSISGTKLWLLGVTAAGQLQSTPNGTVARDPQLMLRWSDTSGKTWSNERILDFGQAGEFKKRAIARRLGRSRDRVYEIAVSDPVPVRIVDAYLNATPGYAPQERLVTNLRKQA